MSDNTEQRCACAKFVVSEDSPVADAPGDEYVHTLRKCFQRRVSR